VMPTVMPAAHTLLARPPTQNYWMRAGGPFSREVDS
jgi:hypothetical protein